MEDIVHDFCRHADSLHYRRFRVFFGERAPRYSERGARDERRKKNTPKPPVLQASTLMADQAVAAGEGLVAGAFFRLFLFSSAFQAVAWPTSCCFQPSRSAAWAGPKGFLSCLNTSIVSIRNKKTSGTRVRINHNAGKLVSVHVRALRSCEVT